MILGWIRHRRQRQLPAQAVNLNIKASVDIRQKAVARRIAAVEAEAQVLRRRA